MKLLAFRIFLLVSLLPVLAVVFLGTFFRELWSALWFAQNNVRMNLHSFRAMWLDGPNGTWRSRS